MICLRSVSSDKTRKLDCTWKHEQRDKEYYALSSLSSLSICLGANHFFLADELQVKIHIHTNIHIYHQHIHKDHNNFKIPQVSLRQIIIFSNIMLLISNRCMGPCMSIQCPNPVFLLQCWSEVTGIYYPCFSLTFELKNQVFFLIFPEQFIYIYIYLS